jgi:hypothetical protein
LEHFLTSDVIDSMRLAVDKARRFPDLANVGWMAYKRAAQTVAQRLSEVAHAAEIGALPAFAPESLVATPRFFINLAVARFLLCALF